MAEEKRRIGRPRSRPEDQGSGDYVGFRASRELKGKLKTAAAASHRSLSTEAQFRLEQSFLNEKILDEAFNMAYGRVNSGLILLIGEIMKTATQSSYHHGNYEHWLDDAPTFRRTVKVLNELFSALRPAGDPNDEINQGIWDRLVKGPVLAVALNRTSDPIRQQLGAYTDRIVEAFKDQLRPPAAESETIGSFGESSPGVWELSYSAGVNPATGEREIAAATVRGDRRDAERELRRLVAIADTQLQGEEPK